MAALKLITGDKRFSSWSLRPWVLMKVAGIPFEEEFIRLRQPDSKANILKRSPSGKVPTLIDGDLVVPDSLAICEYLAERFPEKKLRPEDRVARARARAIVAEMHSGFPDLRNELSMDILATVPTPDLSDGAKTDVARVQAIWKEALTRSGGPFLFGEFTIADAFYAPVVTRFLTYSVAMDDVVRRYADTIMALPAMAEWKAGAEAQVAAQAAADGAA